MNKLLQQALEAHGGLDKWNSFDKISATIVSGGELWPSKGIHVDTTPRRITADTRRQRTTVSPYGAPDFVMTFVPERIVIENGKGETIAERADPRAAFEGHAVDSPWDPLHRAYFSGYALWSYLASPFLLAMPGVEVEEIAPWTEGQEQWRVLRAKFPASFAGHSPVQEFYFGPDFLLRRHDYQVDVSGSFLAAQYVHDMVEAGGIIFPSKRRAYSRKADLQPDTDRLLVWIDLENFQFS